MHAYVLVHALQSLRHVTACFWVAGAYMWLCHGCVRQNEAPASVQGKMLRRQSTSLQVCLLWIWVGFHKAQQVKRVSMQGCRGNLARGTRRHEKREEWARKNINGIRTGNHSKDNHGSK